MEVLTKVDDGNERNDWNDARVMFAYEDNVYEEIQNTKKGQKTTMLQS